MDEADELDTLVSAWARRARDAAYVAVGLGVLGYQNVQAARRILRRAVAAERQASMIADQVAVGLRIVEDRVRQAVTPRD